MQFGEIADRFARRHCTSEHFGASPCEMCVGLRSLAYEIFDEILISIAIDLKRNREGVLEDRGEQ